MTPDPLLTALFDRLPEPGSRFDPFDRNRWLTALSACLDIVYGPQPQADPTTRPTAGQAAGPGPGQRADQPRQGHRPPPAPCPRCGKLFGPHGMPAHLAMHRREDDRHAARAQATPTPDPVPMSGPAAEVAVTTEEPARAPLTIAEPITRQPFDPDAARRRAAAAV